MNGHLWRQFFLTAFNPVFYEGLRYVDLSLFSKDTYPALKLLKNQSTLEILLLAELILQAEDFELQDRCCLEKDFYELFENYDCSQADLKEALLNLYKNYWTELVVDEDGGEIGYEANLEKLAQEKIYVPNKWRHLFRLGLYGNRLCRN